MIRHIFAAIGGAVTGSLIGTALVLCFMLGACGPADTAQAPTPAQTASEPPVNAPDDGPEPPLRLGAHVPKGDPTPRTVTVTRVTDGDTISVEDNGGQKMTLRILGIDTPETVKPRTPVKCGGPEASAYAKKTFGLGATISIAGDATQPAVDIYGRTLAYVNEPGGSDYSLDVLQRGLGRFAEYGSKIDRAIPYANAEATAKKGPVGVWGPPCKGFQK